MKCFFCSHLQPPFICPPLPCPSSPLCYHDGNHCVLSQRGWGRANQKALSHSVASGAVGAESLAFLARNISRKDREGGLLLQRNSSEQAETGHKQQTDTHKEWERAVREKLQVLYSEDPVNLEAF